MIIKRKHGRQQEYTTTIDIYIDKRTFEEKNKNKTKAKNKTQEKKKKLVIYLALISGLNETFINAYIAERTNKAEIRPD